MTLSKEQVKKFQKLYKKHFEKKLSREEAYKKAMKLLSLFNTIYKPIPQKNKNSANNLKNKHNRNIQ